MEHVNPPIRLRDNLRWVDYCDTHSKEQSCYQETTLHDLMEKSEQENQRAEAEEKVYETENVANYTPLCFQHASQSTTVYLCIQHRRGETFHKMKKLELNERWPFRGIPIPLLLSTSGGLWLTRRCHLIPKHEVKLLEHAFPRWHFCTQRVFFSFSLSHSPFSLVTRRHERSRQGKINLLPPSSSCSSPTLRLSKANRIHKN